MEDDDDFDDDEMFLLDEEVLAHSKAQEEARVKPRINNAYKYKRVAHTNLSASCPAKPVVGSLPTPELYDDMPPLSLPNTPASHDEGAKIISSLLTGMRVNEHSRQVFPRLSSSCPQYTSNYIDKIAAMPSCKGVKIPIKMPTASPNSVSSSELSTSQTLLSILQSSYPPRQPLINERSPRARAPSDVRLPPSEPPTE